MADISNSSDNADISAVLNSLLTDLTAVRSAVVAITAKLDADGGVTDTDYNTLNPAALTTTA